MTPTTIAYLAGSFPLRSETFVYREVRALRKRGWTVRVADLHTAPESLCGMEDLAGGVIHVYGKGGVAGRAPAEMLRHPLRSLLTILSAARDALFPGERMSPAARLKLVPQSIAAIGLAGALRGIQHLHCHFAHSPATVGMYAADHLGISFSLTGHANDLFERRALLKRKLQRAAFVACISQWHREFYSEIEPGREKEYQIIRCGVEIDDTTANPVAGDGPTLRVLTLCRLVEKKGVDTLIAALSECSREHRLSWHLQVAGDGPDRQRLGQVAIDHHCADEIEWLGSVDHARVNALLAGADLFALPCRVDRNGDKDGIPVVLMEAMAARVPVIAGNLPAIRELVSSGNNGLLVPGNDVAALASALMLLAGDVPLRRRFGDAGRARVLEEFSLEQNVERLEKAMMASISRRCAEHTNAAGTGKQTDLVIGR